MHKRIFCYILFRLAHWHFYRANINKGIKILENIVKFYPKYDFAYYHLGKIFLEQNQCKKAYDNIIHALKQNPSNSAYHNLLGLILFEQGDYKNAKISLQAAINLDKNNQLTHNYIALCCLGEENIEDFKKIINNQGIFESTDLQIRLLISLEQYLDKKKSNT